MPVRERPCQSVSVRIVRNGDTVNGNGVSPATLVIPCRNEEKRLSESGVLECAKLLGAGGSVILVDDGSTDGTAGLIRKIAAQSPAVDTVFLPENRGKAEAVRAGMKSAAQRGAGRIGFCDADFATPPAEVARVLGGLENVSGASVSGASVDAAIGTRNSRRSENINRSAARGALSRLFSLAASFALKRFVTDSQCGAKFFNNTPAFRKAISEPFISRWGFDVEMLGRLEAAGGKTVEVPLKNWAEKPQSGVGFGGMAKTLFDLRDINGDLLRRRAEEGRKTGVVLETLLTVFVRLAPLYILTYVLGKALFWEGYWVNPDAYYHLGVANAYKELGWLPDFPWLKYTVIGDPFPNVYMLQHIFLAVTSAFVPDPPDPQFAIKTTIVAMAFLQMLSLYLFHRKWGVGNAAIWTVIGITASSNMIWHTIALKGITSFSIMLPWIVDALWSNNGRRAFVIGWASAYTYVGFIILGPLAACRAAGHLIFDGKLRLKAPVLLFAGVAAGMVLSPFFPDHLSHIYRELQTIFERPTFIKAGDFFGLEWQIPSRVQLQQFIGPMMLITLAAAVFHMRPAARAHNTTGAAFITVFVFALFPFFGGIKFAQIFSVISALMVPLIYRDISRFAVRVPKIGVRIKPLVPAAVVFVFFVFSLPFIKVRQIRGRVESPTPRAYAALASTVRALTEEGKVVVAPWDDFPGLFYYNRSNYYISGMNNLFLFKGDSHRFTTYYQFFKGGISDPATVIPAEFDGADLLVVRNSPRNEGEATALKVLDAAPNLVRVTGGNGRVSPGDGLVDGFWRVYKIRR